MAKPSKAEILYKFLKCNTEKTLKGSNNSLLKNMQ